VSDPGFLFEQAVPDGTACFIVFFVLEQKIVFVHRVKTHDGD